MDWVKVRDGMAVSYVYCPIVPVGLVDRVVFEHDRSKAVAVRTMAGTPWLFWD